MADRIPEGWKECKLGEVAEIVGGGTPKTNVIEYWNGKIPWITPRDLSNFNGRFISKGERNISEKGLINSSARILPKGTILLSTRAPVGYLAIAENQMTTNQGFRSLIPFKNTDNIFLFYLLKNNVEYLKSQATGTTFGELSGSVLGSLIFPFPPLSEQRAIASVLSSLDDKIDLLHRENQTLEQMAEAIFRQWFIEEADEEWEEGKLENLIDFEKGKKPKETFELQMPGLVPQILIETFDDGNVMYSKPDGMVIANENDILIVMDGASSGRVEIGFYGIVGSTIGLFRKRSDFPYSLFLYYFLKSKENFIREHTTGSAIPHADKALILNLDVKFSNIACVKKFELIAKDLFEKIKNNRSQIRTLEKLRDTLLPKLMSGEVRVKICDA
jgi:type I restriction enzyme S subunit